MQLHWHTEPFLLLSILSVGWVYAIASGPLRSKIAPQEAFPLGASIRFYLGLIIIYLAVGSPLDTIAELFLFSAHMTQHMLLIYIAPTLLIYGMPAWLIDAFIKRTKLGSLLKFLTNPACGGLLFTFGFTLWHIPTLYEAALIDKRIHILEHFTMFSLGMLMLWPLMTLSQLVPRRSFPIRLITIFLLMVGQLPVFAFLTFAGEAIYPTYAWAPRIIDLDPLNDQILGGIIMKVINMAFSLTLLGLCFYYWAKKEEGELAEGNTL
ncbi:MAG: cytochrome c oxidase assembly protein [Opitutae bacterium]|mgnify:CR=1 FL=1|jgi:putative membrane protein|nr:cytochrome c oxidase assembly protein [Opitutae bacterium]